MEKRWVIQLIKLLSFIDIFCIDIFILYSWRDGNRIFLKVKTRDFVSTLTDRCGTTLRRPYSVKIVEWIFYLLSQCRDALSGKAALFYDWSFCKYDTHDSTVLHSAKDGCYLAIYTLPNINYTIGLPSAIFWSSYVFKASTVSGKLISVFSSSYSKASLTQS